MSKVKVAKSLENIQYEHSAEIASDFLEDEILSKLDEFENNNDDNYVYGMATHGLFAEVVARLGEMGYTEKELKKELKIWLNTSLGQVIH
jgi:hypothetical protein